MSRVIRLAAAAVVLGTGLGVVGGGLSSRAPAQAATAARAAAVAQPARAATHTPGLVYTNRSIGPLARPVPVPARAAAAGKVVPKVTEDPSSVTVASGEKVTFKAGASGEPTPTVKWEVSTNSGTTFTTVTGATATSYSFTAKASQSGDQYKAVFTNAAGTARTTVATLTVTIAPVVTTDPSNMTVTSGGKATFKAGASGKPTPTVKWEVSTNSGTTFTPIAGATATTLSITATAGENSDQYRAVFTNRAGTATTTAGTLTVTSAPVVTTDPSSATVAAGGPATFHAAASGSPTPTLTWEISADSGTTFTPIAGATATTYSFTATAGDNGDRYEAVFTNSAGTATTTAATLTVTTPTTAPAVTTDPSSTTVAAGGTATFNAAAAGSPAPTVVWEVSTDSGTTFTPIAGATAATLSFTATAGENGDQYEAVFTNPAGTATTTAATLTVTSSPVVTTDPSSTTVAAGGTATFKAAAAGSPTPTVVWEVSTDSGTTFTPIAGATAATLSFTATGGDNGDQYEAVFTNPAGTATTTAATLTVTSSPVVTTDPSSTTVAAGGTATFNAAAAGSPTPTVVWEVSTNGGTSFTPVAGATATTYSLTATTGGNGDQYEAVFTNPAGTATTPAATLTVTSVPSLGASTNWSGYAATGSNFSAVTGGWTTPSVTCTGSQSTYSSEWIGIDGDTSSTVEQDGTEADCISGTPSYDAWYELYGDNSENGGSEIELSTASYPVVPGDGMTASVSETGNVWTFVLADTSTHHHDWTFTSAGIMFSAARSSAEWIVERPELCGGSCSLTSLADFGTTGISEASATTSQLAGAPIDSFPSVDIEMVNTADTYVLAQPSGLGSGGNSFTDTWKAAD